MKRVLILLALGLLSQLAYAEFYKLEIKRVDSNLYKSREGIFIETKYCYEYANNEGAVLSYEQYSYDNKLIFNNNQTCDVKRVFK